jgi:hypothetical protein
LSPALLVIVSSIFLSSDILDLFLLPENITTRHLLHPDIVFTSSDPYHNLVLIMLHTIMAALVINNTTINIIRNNIGFDEIQLQVRT